MNGEAKSGRSYPLARRLLRGVALSALVGTGIVIGAIAIFWDADFRPARDRWELFKIAMLGPWDGPAECLPGWEGEECAVASSLADAFEGVDDITFFKLSPINGTKLIVTTGASYADAKSMLAGRTNKRWCYINYTGGSGSWRVSKRVDLADQDGAAAPDYRDFSRLPNTTAREIGLNAERLAALARSHCKFDAFDPKNS